MTYERIQELKALLRLKIKAAIRESEKEKQEHLEMDLLILEEYEAKIAGN